jgi:excisionase family DNA binding protein
MNYAPAEVHTPIAAPTIQAPETGPRVLLTVEQAAERLSISRTNMFKLIKAKDIESVRIGQLRRIPASAIDAYVQRLIEEQNAA